MGFPYTTSLFTPSKVSNVFVTRDFKKCDAVFLISDLSLSTNSTI